MIGNISKGADFSGLFDYLLANNKEAVIIGGNVGGQSPNELTAEFLAFACLNDRVRKPVNHISIGFAPQDGEIDREIQTRIADRIALEMGYGNSQYLVVAHGRSDPGHDAMHEHDHIHIVANAVNLEGRWVNDFQNFRVLENILRAIEKDEGLRQIKSSWEAGKRAPTHGQAQRHKRELREVAAGAREVAILPVIDRLQTAIDAAAGECSSVVELAEKLAELGIETRLKLTRTGLVRGISYQMEGIKFQGNQLYDCSLPKLQSAKDLSFDTKLDPARIHQIVVSPNLVNFEPADRAVMVNLIATQNVNVTTPENVKNTFVTQVDDVEKYFPNRAELLRWWNVDEIRAEIDALGQHLKSDYQGGNPHPGSMPDDYKSDNVSISIVDKERFNQAIESQQLSAAEQIAQQREKNLRDVARNRGDDRPRGHGR
jgi:Relaxase/Mobilisation nuclease domain